MTAPGRESVVAPLAMQPGDMTALTKARLSGLVVVTTMFGYLLGTAGGGFSFWRLLHTLLGTTLCAFAAAVFNQIMEMESDAKMERTADRPLPAKRIPPELAFILGTLLAAMGVLHLLMKVNVPAAIIAASTIACYIFVYTPLKTRSSANTLVGAISGALPPVIGWAAADQPWRSQEALFLFGLLFFWQLPHFLAINWMYREQYERGGFVMWSNGDKDGRRTAKLSLGFTLAMFFFMLLPGLKGLVHWAYLLGTCLLTGYMLLLAIRFTRQRERSTARRLFFYTLIYLPLILTLIFFTWKKPSP